jgi:hypothetical protein
MNETPTPLLEYETPRRSARWMPFASIGLGVIGAALDVMFWEGAFLGDLTVILVAGAVTGGVEIVGLLLGAAALRARNSTVSAAAGVAISFVALAAFVGLIGYALATLRIG